LLTRAELLMTRDAVAMETPASFATSARVGAVTGTLCGELPGVSGELPGVVGTSDNGALVGAAVTVMNNSRRHQMTMHGSASITSVSNVSALSTGDCAAVS
jgi:hypothetical protein